MSEFDFDFSANNEETKIEASIPVGKYVAMIDEVTTNDKGTLVFKLSIIESETGDTTYQGRKLFDYKSFSEKAKKFSLEAIKRMSGSVYGKEIGYKLVFKSVDDYRLTFMNRTVKLSVKHEEFNGDMQAKVGFYMERNTDDPFVAANIQARNELMNDPSVMASAEQGESQKAIDDCPF